MTQLKFKGKLASGLRTGLIYLLILLLAAFLGNLWMSRNQATGLAPEISGQAMDGRWTTIRPGDYAGPVLVYFFADWCPICKFQHAAIESVNESYPVIAIAMQSGDLANVNSYISKQKLDLNVLNDASGDISRSFGVNGVPASFIIDRKSIIRYSTRGYATQAGLLSRLWLAGMQ